MTSEAQELRALLGNDTYDDWRTLTNVGDLLGDWETIDRISKGSGRWSEYIAVITRNNKSGQAYRWEYEEGLTEYQESDYSGAEPEPVYAVERTVVVKEWKVADK